MPSRDWIARVAIGVVLALAALGVLGTLSYQQHRKDESERAAAAEPDTSGVQQKCALISSFEAFIACVAEQTKAEHAQQHAEADLRAQNEMAVWTAGMFVFAVLAFVTGGIGVALLLLNLLQIEEQSQIIREQFIAERRPWLKVSVSISEAEIRGKAEPNVFLKVCIKNIGLSPAYRVHFDQPARLCNESDGPASLLQRSIESYRANPWATGFAMLPGDKESDIALLKLTRDRDSKTPAQSKHVIGWVAFSLSPDGPPHFTPICQRLFWLASEGEVVSADEIRLSPSTLGIGPD